MDQQQYPPGWDEARVKRLIEHYDNMSDGELLAEDEAARKAGKSTWVRPESAPKVNGKPGARNGRHPKRKQAKPLGSGKRRNGKKVAAKPRRAQAKSVAKR